MSAHSLCCFGAVLLRNDILTNNYSVITLLYYSSWSLYLRINVRPTFAIQSSDSNKCNIPEKKRNKTRNPRQQLFLNRTRLYDSFKDSVKNEYLVKWHLYPFMMGFPGGSVVKKLPANAGDVGSIPGLGRFSREGNGNPLQYSYLENPIDRVVLLATVPGVTESRTLDSGC